MTLDQSKSHTSQNITLWTSILCWSSPLGKLHTHSTKVTVAHMGLEHLLLELLLKLLSRQSRNQPCYPPVLILLKSPQSCLKIFGKIVLFLLQLFLDTLIFPCSL